MTSLDFHHAHHFTTLLPKARRNLARILSIWSPAEVALDKHAGRRPRRAGPRRSPQAPPRTRPPCRSSEKTTRDAPHRNARPCNLKQANPEPSAQGEAGQRRVQGWQCRRESSGKCGRLCSQELLTGCTGLPAGSSSFVPGSLTSPPGLRSPGARRKASGTGQSSVCGRRRHGAQAFSGRAGWMDEMRRRQAPRGRAGLSKVPPGRASGYRPPTPGFSERQDFKVFIF